MQAIKIYIKSTILLGLLSFSLNSFSSEQLKLVTGNDYAPFCDEKLKEGGSYTAIVKRILNKLKINYSIEFLPWARGFEMVKNSKYDATFPYAYTKERSLDIKYSEVSLVDLKIYIYANIRFKNMIYPRDFKGTTFCAPLGYIIEEPILSLINKNEIKKVQKFNEKSCVDSVINNEANFMAINEEQYDFYKKQNIEFFDRIVKINNLISKTGLYLIYRKDFDNNLIKRIDQEAKIFLNTNDYKELRFQK